MSDEVRFVHIMNVPTIPKDEWGVEHKAQCSCGGTITAIRSTENGHLHARCDKCGFRLME